MSTDDDNGNPECQGAVTYCCVSAEHCSGGHFLPGFFVIYSAYAQMRIRKFCVRSVFLLPAFPSLQIQQGAVLTQ